MGAYEFEPAIPAVSGWGMLTITLLVLTAGVIALRASMGLVCAREFTRQALAESRGR